MALGKRYVVIGAIILLGLVLVFVFMMPFYSRTSPTPDVMVPAMAPPPAADSVPPPSAPETSIGLDLQVGGDRPMDASRAPASSEAPARLMYKTPALQAPAAKNGDTAMPPAAANGGAGNSSPEMTAGDMARETMPMLAPAAGDEPAAARGLDKYNVELGVDAQLQ